MSIALALSGGGVFGAAHVGPLEELDRIGLRPDFVVGTSAGAIVGLLYASGGVDAVNRFLDRLADMFSSPAALLLNTPPKIFTYVQQTLSELVGPEPPRTPFYSVATNLRTGRPEAFHGSDSVVGVMASAAFPGVFPVQAIGGERYVDGGLTACLPAGIAWKLAATTVIGSSVYYLPDISPSTAGRASVVWVAQRSLDILQAELAREQAALCTFCFHPPDLTGYRWYDLRDIREIREAGRLHARCLVSSLTASLDRQANHIP